ncbi:hypothetical protein MTO96_041154 [Rhipicephalus appendiculatus]
MLGSSHKLPEVDAALDAVIDKEAERLGVEAVQVGQVLSAISDGLRDTAKGLGGAENQAEQYFFDKIINVAKAVGKGVEGLATVKLIVKDLSLYALEDGKAHKDFREHVAEDLSRVAESLIKKGELLCSCRGRSQLDDAEAKLVQDVVEAF